MFMFREQILCVDFIVFWKKYMYEKKKLNVSFSLKEMENITPSLSLW